MDTQTNTAERYEVVTDGSHLARERIGGWAAHVRRMSDEVAPLSKT